MNVTLCRLAIANPTRSRSARIKGEGGCCGGGSYRLKPKKLPSVRYKETFTVKGMHCKQCKKRIEEAVNGLVGISGRVDLKKGLLTVSYAETPHSDTVINQLKKVGYQAEKKS